MKRLEFVVVSCSTQEEGFPADQLGRAGRVDRGWQSARLQEFPQELIVSFKRQVKISQVSFLSHESKISSKIELYVGKTEDAEDTEWQRLGFLLLDSNEDTGLQSRELRSVFLDCDGFYLKIVLNKCHMNHLNLFNQVGLYAVNVLGEEIQTKNRNSPGKPTDFDSATSDELTRMQREKLRAVESEDFDEAQRLKTRIEHLKQVGYQLKHLEECKNKAIALEDYETAKIIKTQMQRMRDSGTTQHELRPEESFQETPADLLVSVLGDPIAKKIFSHDWELREEALTCLQSALADLPNSDLFVGFESDDIYSVVLGAISYTIGDDVAQVSLKAMNLVNILFSSSLRSSKHLLSDIAECISRITAHLIEKTGNPNIKLRETAEQVFISMIKHRVVSIDNAVRLIEQDTNASPKHVSGKLSLLTAVVYEFKIDTPDTPFALILNYAMMGFSHSSSEVRNSAYYLIHSIYSQIGPKVMKYLKSLAPAQLQILEKGFTESEALSHHSPKKPAAAPLCKFCGKTEGNFTQQDALDIHYWKDCPMLVPCTNCTQIIEILHLNNHMVSECENAGEVKECTQCKTPIRVQDHQAHVEAANCTAAREGTFTCPLCQEDVPVGNEAWKSHILKEGCPNNERSNSSML